MIDIHEPSPEQASIDDLRAALSVEVEREQARKPEHRTAPTHAAFTVIESGKRLSESMIWKLQREYYQTRGPEAWTEQQVPHYITSNGWLARSYAQLLAAWLRDCGTQHVSGPVYIVELAAGLGKLAFLVLRELEKRIAGDGSIPEFRYVLTDFVQSNIDFWKQHNQLKPFVDSGRLDFAVFDLESDTGLTLEIAGTQLNPTSKTAPLFVVANYAFDSVPQDVFTCENRKLHEYPITISAPANSAKKTNVELDSIQWSYEVGKPVAKPYKNTEWNALAQDWAARLNHGELSIPVTILRALERLDQLADGQLTVLASDKGIWTPGTAANSDVSGFTQHGSISMMVNFGVIGAWFETRGGRAAFPDHFARSLAVCLFASKDTGELANLWRTYQCEVAPTTADNFFHIKTGIERNFSTLTPLEIINYIRWTGMDARAMGKSIAVLTSKAAEIARENIADEIAQTALACWENYYHVASDFDLAFQLGTLLYELDRYDAAIGLFGASLQLHGEDAGTFCNLGMCYFQLENWGEATRNLQQALHLKPAYPEANDLLKRIPAG